MIEQGFSLAVYKCIVSLRSLMMILVYFATEVRQFSYPVVYALNTLSEDQAKSDQSIGKDIAVGTGGLGFESRAV